MSAHRAYVSFRSYPDYLSGTPFLVGIHGSLEDAIRALYPQGAKFTRIEPDEWMGPDGFGLIRLMDVEVADQDASYEEETNG
jgi:hypothetical protein